MKNEHYLKDVIWSIEDLEKLEKFYALEFNRTSNIEFQKKRLQIHKYLQDYQEMLEKLDSSIELRIYKYLKHGLNPSKTVKKVAEENYLNDVSPFSEPQIWRYYKKVEKLMK